METKIRKLIHKYQNHFLDLLAPRNCTGCNERNEILCDKCLRISFKPGGSCVFCNFRNNTGKICRECRKIYEPGFEKIFWAGEYGKALKNAVIELKYKKRKELAEPLGQLIFKKFKEYYQNYTEENFLIIPVPLYPKKEYERGFNQAELIAREFSKLSNISIAADLLLKIKDTRAQVETKNRESRIKNLESAFLANQKKLMTYGMERKTIILVDDVATTGATFLHISRTLSRAGFSKIICLAIAHGYG